MCVRQCKHCSKYYISLTTLKANKKGGGGGGGGGCTHLVKVDHQRVATELIIFHIDV